MQHLPTPEWLQKYEPVKQKLSSPTDFNRYFDSAEICEKRLFKIEVGGISFPTGNVIVRDPLVYLAKDALPYHTKIPIGIFPLTILVVEMEADHYRYVGFRLKLSSSKAVTYTEALLGNENLDNFQEGEYFGFHVDAGLATIVDQATRDAYCSFVENWQKSNPDQNIYDHFFAAEFKKSSQSAPAYQRDGGDWINFTIPDTELTIPMIQSGFGDGTYPVYFGYDKQGAITEIVAQFIDIELTFSEEEEENI